MRSPLLTISPSFLRNLLMCTSILRSNKFRFRPSTFCANSSRETILPAERSSVSRRLNSTEVSSTISPFRVAAREPRSSSPSPPDRRSPDSGDRLPFCGPPHLPPPPPPLPHALTPLVTQP